MFWTGGSILSRPTVVSRAKTPHAAYVLDGSRVHPGAASLPSFRVRGSVAIAQFDRPNARFPQPSLPLSEASPAIGALNAQTIEKWRPCRPLQSRICTKASGSEQLPGPLENDFFGRSFELDYLERIFNYCPFEILFLVGPRDSGKTAS